MTQSTGKRAAEDIADEYERRASVIRAAIVRVEQGEADNVLVALWEEAHAQKWGSMKADFPALVGRLVERCGGLDAALRFLVDGRLNGLGDQTPLQAIEEGQGIMLIVYLELERTEQAKRANARARQRSSVTGVLPLTPPAARSRGPSDDSR